MRITSEPIPDIINKWLKFTEVFSQKGLEFWPSDETSTLVAILVLDPMIVDSYVEEKGCKRGMVRPNGLHYVKIVFFALFIKIIVVYVRFFII